MLSKIQIAADKSRNLIWASPLSHCFTTRRRKSSSRINMVMNQSSAKVQSLYQLCKSTLSPSSSAAAVPPSSSAAQKICSLLDSFGPDDVGLREETSDDDRGHGIFGLQRLSRVARWSQPITYIDVYECDSFTMCIFCFPTSSVIPLHDHPGMTVFSKVLYGSLHVKAYDWVEPPCISESKKLGVPPSARLAKFTVDKVLTAPCGTSVLYPNAGGNLHCFTALTPCAVLDILTPSYNEPAGRKCTYYHDYPASTLPITGAAVTDGETEDYAWLSEIETPDDLHMRSGRYTGPAIHL
ncbi:Plant cysteine oxidase 3 [Linum grandiflorum]